MLLSGISSLSRNWALDNSVAAMLLGLICSMLAACASPSPAIFALPNGALIQLPPRGRAIAEICADVELSVRESRGDTAPVFRSYALRDSAQETFEKLHSEIISKGMKLVSPGDDPKSSSPLGYGEKMLSTYYMSEKGDFVLGVYYWDFSRVARSKLEARPARFVKFYEEHPAGFIIYLMPVNANWNGKKYSYFHSHPAGNQLQ